MEALIPITITIADRSFRIKVEAAHEESVRKTARFINEKLLEFKQNFAGKDMQDYVSMVLIWYATQPPQEVGNQLLQQDLAEGFARLEALIDKGLSGANSHDEA
ncbi:MAG TPA: cell division protein ZapA [Phnomibacter sp.]|nr:cell division protein ZapA [Phnomibacter sp.]